MKKLFYNHIFLYSTILLMLFLIACQKNGIIEEVDAAGNSCFNTYNDGELDGLSTCYYYNKQKKSESIYIEGERKDHESWYEDGIVSERISYSYGSEKKMNGHRTWHKNGKQDMTKLFDGNGNIMQLVYYFTSGEIAELQNYKDGELDGKETIRHWNWEIGKPYTYAHYIWKEGKKDSIQLQYNKYGCVDVGENYINGQVRVRLKYKYVNKYDEKGTLVLKETWDEFGNEIKYKRWDINGNEIDCKQWDINGYEEECP